MRKALCDLLQDENWQVVSAAVRSLRKRNELEAVVPLVKAMQNAKGRLLEDFHEGVVTITGYKFGLDPANWKAWLDETGGEVTPTPNRGRTRPRRHLPQDQDPLEEHDVHN
ncbi:MAG: hypothetical protein U5N86_09485 [Planctomycetota bacterium]|nr:hypothetical protein [Planctomycetota bacterium]